VLVGDTPLDVAAGREAGARVVAVASSSFGVGELEAAGADRVLENLRDAGALVRSVVSDGPERA
jgi:phosphoglycolate phosphatase